MKEPKPESSSLPTTTRPNLSSRSDNVCFDEKGQKKQLPSSNSDPSSHVRNLRRYGRSQSTGGYSEVTGDKRRRDLDELEHRRRYVATILERYYSHPSNRQRSLPLNVKEHLLNALAPDGEDQRAEMDSADVPVAGEDSVSEVSSAVSCTNKSDGPANRAGNNGTTTDSSPYYDQEKDGVEPGKWNKHDGGKKKSRFFRSASMRSLKRWMNKLRGRSKAGATDGRKKTSSESGTVSPLSDAVLRNGLGAPNHEDPTFGSFSGTAHSRQQNSANFHVSVDRRDSADCAVSSGRGRARNTQAPAPSVSDIPTPALCGILNHGNTCYINAVVQCLSNTDVLSEYFLSGQYWTDLRNNLRNADRYGSQGNVTLALARFLKALWFNTYTPEVSSNFKSIMERYSEQYRGNQQQDAQEFFYWLADRVHEDLNVAVKRRYKLHKSRSKNEDELAAAAMEKHLEAHNSFVSSRFHGLFLSTVTCPVCRKQSMKPDPFMCISLPVSQCTKRPLFVIVVFVNRQPRQVRFGLNADVTATFLEVKKCLADATDLAIDQMLLCEMNEGGFQTTLADHHEVMSLGRTKCIWAFEVPTTPPAATASPDEELVLLVSNYVASNGNGFKFASPLAVRVSREVTYSDLCRTLLLALRPQFKTHIAIQEVSLSLFRMRIVDDFHPYAYIPNDVALPLFTQAVDNALMHLASTSSATALPHLKLMLEWQRDAKERYFIPVEERLVDHVSAQDLRDQEEHPEVQSLHDCLAEYTRPEPCQWYCPDCRHRQDSAAKRIVFYWLPDVLVLHLKRFKQLSSGQLVKLDATVWFPVSDLDLSDYTHQSISRNHSKRQRSMQSYRTQNGELYIDTRPSQNLYDLYAVCNHSGHSPHSGHYTAFCRNPVNGRWYCFDDQSVTPVRERDLVTNGAYLLFYERRQLRKGSEGHNSAESGFVDHWFFRIYSNHIGERQRRASHSSKDTSDGVESASGLTWSGGEQGHRSGENATRESTNQNTVNKDNAGGKGMIKDSQSFEVTPPTSNEASSATVESIRFDAGQAVNGTAHCPAEHCRGTDGGNATNMEKVSTCNADKRTKSKLGTSQSVHDSPLLDALENRLRNACAVVETDL